MKTNRSHTRLVEDGCACDPIDAIRDAIAGKRRLLCPIHDAAEIALQEQHLRWEIEQTHRKPEPEPEPEPGAKETITNLLDSGTTPDRQHLPLNSPGIAELVAQAFGPNAVVVDSTPDL